MPAKNEIRSASGKLGYEASKEKLLDRCRRVHEENVRAYLLKDKKCPWCKEPIPYEKRKHTCCSHSCARKLSASKRPSSKKKIVGCKRCGKERPVGNKVYCSHACKVSYKLEHDVSILLSEENFRLDPRPQKLALLYLRGHRCEICGLEEWQGKDAPLVMDHIDGNADNNRFENLRLVCGNCDMQLPTYKAKNAGRGRYSRRQRYKEGKSY